MKNAITAELKEFNLQVNDHAITKVIQLYETKTSRHAVMIVGGTQSGKTVMWRILQASMTRLNKDGDTNYQQVKVSVVLLFRLNDWFDLITTVIL